MFSSLLNEHNSTVLAFLEKEYLLVKPCLAASPSYHHHLRPIQNLTFECLLDQKQCLLHAEIEQKDQNLSFQGALSPCFDAFLFSPLFYPGTPKSCQCSSFLSPCCSEKYTVGNLGGRTIYRTNYSIITYCLSLGKTSNNFAEFSALL